MKARLSAVVALGLMVVALLLPIGLVQVVYAQGAGVAGGDGVASGVGQGIGAVFGDREFSRQPGGEGSDGATAQELAIGLYCSGRNLLTGQFGLLLGLVLVFMGLWGLINGSGWFAAVLSIIIGAAIPSIPGLVEGFMQGYGTLLKESGMTSKTLDLTSLQCGNGQTSVPDSAVNFTSGPDDVRRKQFQRPTYSPTSGGMVI